MIQSRLSGIMRQELEFLQVHFSPYCVQQVEQMIGNGIKRMKVNNTIDHAGYVMQAERNLKALLKYFSDYAKQEGTFPELKDKDFDAAMKTCPILWPFSASG